ncbi:MAG TPA: FG-GAP-like repeat-containing protein [Bacteroidota bacterium]|nr:FG-GAP-like repeat-containing protein [Bacteroidota bacterium]
MKQSASGTKLHLLCLLTAIVVHVLALRQGLAGTNGMTLRTITGQTPFAGFGYSVANARDVNGDGYPDLIVGNYISYAGRAYIYFGGPGMDTIPDVTMINHDNNDYFGMAVAGPGDMNGDGYADVVVGAHVSGSLGLDSGHVYIFFGGAVMDSIPDVVMAGLPSELFGRSVAGAGDANGDGYADVIVGANGSDAAGLDVGRAYIFFGGATVDNVPDVTITGTVVTENLGNSVASAGDVNNDGYDDVIVGAYANDLPSGNNLGKAYLHLGGNPMNNVVDVTFNGSASFDYFGLCVAGAGDVNNDGYDDVLVSSRGNNVQGRTSLYLGGSVMNNVADVRLNGEAVNNYFGESAGSAGDVNSDGYADIIIGAFGYNSFTGKAYVYCGGVSMDTIPDMTFLGEATSDRFGLSAAGAGDVNGDGYGDVIVGAYANSANTGRAYLFLSSDGPLPIQLASFTATSIGEDQVRLDWTTLAEVNNYGFEIQRKRDEEPSYSTLPNSFIPGHGTTNVPHSYSFIDSTVFPEQWSYRLKQIDLDGTVHYTDPVNVTVLTSVIENSVPTKYALHQNYPNPFNPSTTIRYSLPVQSHVTLKVYDVLGREVATLVDGVEEEGYKQVLLDGKLLSSGVYYYRISANGVVDPGQSLTQVKRMLLIK